MLRRVADWGSRSTPCLVKKCAKASSKEAEEEALPAGSMPGRLGAMQPHISSYPARLGRGYVEIMKTYSRQYRQGVTRKEARTGRDLPKTVVPHNCKGKIVCNVRS